jgi:hypothetical protein
MPKILSIMPPTRFEPSQVKNKIKREELLHKKKKSKIQEKLKRRLAQAELEKDDPTAKKVLAHSRKQTFVSLIAACISVVWSKMSLEHWKIHANSILR